MKSIVSHPHDKLSNRPSRAAHGHREIDALFTLDLSTVIQIAIMPAARVTMPRFTDQRSIENFSTIVNYETPVKVNNHVTLI